MPTNRHKNCPLFRIGNNTCSSIFQCAEYRLIAILCQGKEVCYLPLLISLYLYDEYGLDGISAGVIIACITELHEQEYMLKENAMIPIEFGE